jgi:hypothetical protein
MGKPKHHNGNRRPRLSTYDGMLLTRAEIKDRKHIKKDNGRIAFGRHCPPVARDFLSSMFPKATEISPPEMQDRIKQTLIGRNGK